MRIEMSQLSLSLFFLLSLPLSLFKGKSVTVLPPQKKELNEESEPQKRTEKNSLSLSLFSIVFSQAATIM